MATATIKTVPPVPVAPVRVVHLELSIPEAEVLRSILYWHIGGAGPAREILDGIADALLDVNVQAPDLKVAKNEPGIFLQS